VAEKLRIFPILKSQLQFDVSPPIFEPLATQVLGNAATDGDGFNADLLAVAQQLESDTALVSAGDQDLADAGFTPGQFASANIDPLVAETGTFNSSGDSLLNNLNDAGQVPSNPAPTTQPCQQVKGSFNLPACDFPNWKLDLKFNAGPYQVGACKVVIDTTLYDKDHNKLSYKGIGVLQADAAFKSVNWKHDAREDPHYYTILELTFDGAKKGHFQAVMRLDTEFPTNQLVLGVCIDIVDSAELQSKVQTSLLPLNG